MGVMKMLRIKYKIQGEKPDLLKILSKMQNDDYTIMEDNDIMYLTILLKDDQEMKELLRRLKPKNFRFSTNVEIVEKQMIAKKDEFEQKFSFSQLGYKTKVQRRGYSFAIGINKLLALGNNLNKGNELYVYSGHDDFGRSMLLIYLDRFPRNNHIKPVVIDRSSFIQN